MWFVFALVTFLAWGGADLFYKKSNGSSEACSHLKTSVAVGFVMGAAALVTLLTRDLSYDPRNLIIYLPVSLMYILSMTVGYYGLRYLELSISSPVQNASGAVSAILLMLVLHELPDAWTAAAICLITAGVILLGVFERRSEIGTAGEEKYRRSFAAILFPVAYCVIDSLGTFLDGWYLDDVSASPLLGVTEDTLEDVANVSYQLTFFIAALLLLVYITAVKKEKFPLRGQKDRFLAALLETAGQLTYVYALSGNGIAAAPLIGSYCVASLLLGRVVLREKLEKKQYAAIALVLSGIVIMGVLEGIEG